MGKMRWLWVPILSIIGCGPKNEPKFVDDVVGGVPNMEQIAPNLWRMGQPVNADAWKYVHSRVARPWKGVVIIKLNDEKEGSDKPAESFGSWQVVRIPLPPEDDKPWTVLEKPHPQVVSSIVHMILKYHEAGYVVAWHCTHGRDRTGLITAIVQRNLLHWTKQQAWDGMIAHGFRWELPDLDAYWIENVH